MPHFINSISKTNRDTICEECGTPALTDHNNNCPSGATALIEHNKRPSGAAALIEHNKRPSGATAHIEHNTSKLIKRQSDNNCPELHIKRRSGEYAFTEYIKRPSDSINLIEKTIRRMNTEKLNYDYKNYLRKEPCDKCHNDTCGC